MKKAIIALAVTLTAALFISQAWAQWQGGHGKGYHGTGFMAGNTDAAPETYRAFMDETAGLRGELAAARAEHRALMRQANPDPQRAAELSRKMVQLREQIRTKAGAHGIDAPYGAFCGGAGGQGRGHMGMGRCW